MRMNPNEHGFQCLGKSAFPSEEDAEKYRLGLPKATRPQRVYPCTLCTGWHMTKKNAKSGKSRRKQRGSW